MNRIITISRQFGSAGHTIGKAAAQRLGIPCYDSEIIDEVVKQSGLSHEFIKDKSEYASGTNWFTSALNNRDFSGFSHQDEVWAIQCKIVKEMADKGPCVMVGRCADYILKDIHDIVRVFIFADMEDRAKRIVEQYGESPVAPVKRLKDKDKRRAAYYNFYTDIKWGAAENYDITLNSASLGIDKCVDIVSMLY